MASIPLSELQIQAILVQEATLFGCYIGDGIADSWSRRAYLRRPNEQHGRWMASWDSATPGTGQRVQSKAGRFPCPTRTEPIGSLIRQMQISEWPDGYPDFERSLRDRFPDGVRPTASLSPDELLLAESAGGYVCIPSLDSELHPDAFVSKRTGLTFGVPDFSKSNDAHILGTSAGYLSATWLDSIFHRGRSCFPDQAEHHRLNSSHTHCSISGVL
jgi:hypothetical protein